MGEGGDRRAQGRTAEIPAALSAGRVRASHDGRGLRADELARPPPLRDLPGGAGREVRRCAGLGAVPGLSRDAGRDPGAGRLDRRHLRLRLGGSQLFTGRLSDHVGRFWPNVLGMWICGAGVAMVVMGTGALWWSVSAGVAGFGMALLYPNLSAAVADITPPAWRGSAIGIYRFWRDLGYASAHSVLAGGEPDWCCRSRLLVRRDLDVRLRGLALLWGEETTRD